MKIIITSIFLIAGLFSQSSTTFVGGINMGNVSANDSSEDLDPIMKIGAIVGAEITNGGLTVGLNFVQRGYSIDEEEDFDGYTVSMSGSTTLNYINFYGLYPYNLPNNISVFGGFQGGLGLGGESEIETDIMGMSIDLEEDIEAEDMEFDYGLLFGADYMINDNIGIRFSYYHGLADIAKDLDSDENMKNTGILLGLLYNN